MQTIFNLYDQFLSNFPDQYHSLISLIILVVFIGVLYNLVKKNLIWLLLLILLIPASIPILNNVWQGILEILRYLVGVK